MKWGFGEGDVVLYSEDDGTVCGAVHCPQISIFVHRSAKRLMRCKLTTPKQRALLVLYKYMDVYVFCVEKAWYVQH